MDDDYRKFSARYSVSHMSNSKWLRLFRAVSESGIEIQKSNWYFIDSEDVLQYPMPNESQLFEERFEDGLFQPFEYKWIKSIHIPNQYKPTPGVGYIVEQDTRGLLAAISISGKFATEFDNIGLWILGYED
ncbi:MAG: hypothetical protein JKX76_04215 [Colwellia sp.]|nr:hypothetical protein [Colwellia sp.]